MTRERNKRQTIKWNFIFYIFEFMYLIATGFLLIPLYLKYISKDMYGYWLASGNVLQLVTIINPGFSDVIQQRISFNYGIKNKEKIGGYSCVGILLTFIFSLIIAIVGYIVYLNLHVIFDTIPDVYISDLRFAFLLMLIGSILLINYYSIGAIDYAMMSSKSIGCINLTSNLIALLTTVLMLTKGYGIISLGGAALARGLCFILGSSLYTYYRFKTDNIHLRLDYSLLKEVFSLIGFNFLGKISSSLTTQLNSILSTKLVSPLASANLKFTQTVPDFGRIVVMRILNSVNPILPNLYAEKGVEGIKEYINYLIIIMIWGIGLLSVGFTLLNKYFMHLWIGTSNYSGDLINLLIVCSISISLLSWFFSQMLFAFGDIKNNNIVLFVQSVIYLILSIILTLKFAIVGLLFASIFCQLMGFILYFLRRFLYLLRYNRQEKKALINRILYTLLVSLISYYVSGLLLLKSSTWLNFLMNVLICTAVYIIVLMINKTNWQVAVKLVNRFRLK